MKALYARYGETIFKMLESPSNNFENARIEPSKVQYKYFSGRNQVDVDVTLGLIHEDFKTNKEVLDETVDYLKEKKVLSIKSLDPVYEIAVDFTLIDEGRNQIVDEGVMVRHIMGKELKKFRILGIDEFNELHHRIVKEFEGTFSWKYLQSLPCGIIGKADYSYTLLINNVMIHQLIHDEERLTGSNDFLQTFHKSSEGVAITRETFASRYTKPEDVVIFDSKAEGINIDPVHFEDKMSFLNLKINLILNDYFEVYDEETITSVLEENATPEVTTEPDASVDEPEV